MSYNLTFYKYQQNLLNTAHKLGWEQITMNTFAWIILMKEYESELKPFTSINLES